MRLVDYLETREDVDARRIGLTGISKGGMEAYLAAAVDPRIAVAVPLIGVQSFRWALDHGAWDSRAWTLREAVVAAASDAKAGIDAAFMRKFYDRVAPGVRDQFDGPAMLPLIAPRPLLVINGDLGSTHASGRRARMHRRRGTRIQGAKRSGSARAAAAARHRASGDGRGRPRNAGVVRAVAGPRGK